MGAGYKFMPFPYTQRLSSPLPCDEGLLLFELSATMYSSWAIAFDQYIHLKEHSLLLSGFLMVKQSACMNSLRVINTTIPS